MYFILGKKDEMLMTFSDAKDKRGKKRTYEYRKRSTKRGHILWPLDVDDFLLEKCALPT
jgi:hypothetical protein